MELISLGFHHGDVLQALNLCNNHSLQSAESEPATTAPQLSPRILPVKKLLDRDFIMNRSGVEWSEEEDELRQFDIDKGQASQDSRPSFHLWQYNIRFRPRPESDIIAMPSTPVHTVAKLWHGRTIAFRGTGGDGVSLPTINGS